MQDQLSKDERETLIAIQAADREICHIYSSDPVYWRKLEKVGASIVKSDDWGRWYELPSTQLTLRKASKRKPMSDEEKMAFAERMRKSR